MMEKRPGREKYRKGKYYVYSPWTPHQASVIACSRSRREKVLAGERENDRARGKGGWVVGLERAVQEVEGRKEGFEGKRKLSAEKKEGGTPDWRSPLQGVPGL